MKIPSLRKGRFLSSTPPRLGRIASSQLLSILQEISPLIFTPMGAVLFRMSLVASNRKFIYSTSNKSRRISSPNKILDLVGAGIDSEAQYHQGYHLRGSLTFFLFCGHKLTDGRMGKEVVVYLCIYNRILFCLKRKGNSVISNSYVKLLEDVMLWNKPDTEKKIPHDLLPMCEIYVKAGNITWLTKAGNRVVRGDLVKGYKAGSYVGCRVCRYNVQHGNYISKIIPFTVYLLRR